MTADASIDPTDPSTWPSHCPKCGVALTKKRQCMGHSSRTGKHCGKTALRGARVCGTHGGSLSRTKLAAEDREAAAQAQRAAATYGLPRQVEPHDALLEELHRTAGHVAWLGVLIAELEHEDSIHPRAGGDVESDEDRSSSGLSGLKQYHRDKNMLWEKPSVWVELYQHERTHLAKVAKTCIDAGIAERQVQLAESQGRLLADVVRQIVTGLGHDLQDERVREVVVPALQLVRAA
jgi:hypothetical protein